MGLIEKEKCTKQNGCQRSKVKLSLATILSSTITDTVMFLPNTSVSSRGENVIGLILGID